MTNNDTGSGEVSIADHIAMIRARLAAATPGPWASAWDDDEVARPDSDDVIVSQAMGVADDDRVIVGGMFYDGMWAACRRENAALIAHAPSDIAYLLDRISHLEWLLGRLRTYGLDGA